MLFVVKLGKLTANEADLCPTSNFDGGHKSDEVSLLTYKEKILSCLLEEKCLRKRETNECYSFLHYPGKES